MKTNVIYYTMTGHSKKIAKVVGKELGVEALNIKSNPKLGKVDLLYIVSGIYEDKSSPELIEYVKTLTKKEVSKIVLITSSGAKTTKAIEIRKILEDNSINVLKEEFTCPGGFLFFGGHPNKEDISNIISFVKKTSK